MRNRSDRSYDESGFTVAEMTVASAILVAALAVFLGALASLQRTTQYETGRSRALDEMRITAGQFARDIRHAERITAFREVPGTESGDLITMSTYVERGRVDTVTNKLQPDPTDPRRSNLVRDSSGGADRLYVIRLTSKSVFRPYPFPGSGDPSGVRRVELHMQTEPTRDLQPVILATEVSLRNVTGQ